MYDYSKDKQKKEKFVQEYAYVEDYSLYYPLTHKKDEDEESYAVVVIDTNNVTTFEI